MGMIKGFKNPYPTEGMAIPENIPWSILNSTFEAGAAEYKRAIWKLAEESPTGTFTFDTNAQHFRVFIEEK